MPSSEAKMSTQVATGLLPWLCRNESVLVKFSVWLYQSLEVCFEGKGCIHLRREKMWRDFHKVRTSVLFRRQWELFLERAGQVALSTFYQYVTNEFFKEMIKMKHQFDRKKSSESANEHITMEHRNALRYVAGHVCRKVQRQLSKSKAPNYEDMILFIMDLSGDEADEDNGTEKWVNAIDRGGLWHVNDDTYTIFCIAEEECRRHFRIDEASSLHAGAREILYEKIMSNEDLMFHWSILSSRVDNEVVLGMLITLYITIRGFSFVRSCLELYKQAHHKRLQKSKALRREVQQTSKEDTEAIAANTESAE